MNDKDRRQEALLKKGVKACAPWKSEKTHVRAVTAESANYNEIRERMEQKDEIQNYVNIFQNIIIVLVAGIGSIFYYWMANVTEISDNQFETMLFFAVILTSLVLIFSTLFWLFNRQLRRFK